MDTKHVTEYINHIVASTANFHQNVTISDATRSKVSLEVVTAVVKLLSYCMLTIEPINELVMQSVTGKLNLCGTDVETLPF
jgi:hypothetical protein